MNIRFAILLFSVVITVGFYSCKNVPEKNHGPIVLGDSTNIVTEKDQKKLLDLVIDLQPDIPPAADPDSAAKETKQNNLSSNDTANNTKILPVEKHALPDIAGLKAEFKEVSILIPDITAKLSGNPNLKVANGAVYTLLNGKLDGNIITITGNVTKVWQKCQSVVVLKNKLGTLPLENLSSTSKWETVKAGKNGYSITNIDGESLDYPKTNNYAIRNAVNRAAIHRHLNRKKMQEWLNSVSSVHSANQKPLYIVLRSVIWKIDGKDESGKSFSKQIRIDIPI